MAIVFSLDPFHLRVVNFIIGAYPSLLPLRRPFALLADGEPFVVLLGLKF